MTLEGPASTLRDVAFFSYSHRDKADWLEKFLVLLKPYLRRGWLEIWADPYIPVGERWQREIDAALRRARVGVLLCSPDFAASDFIADVELPALVAAAESRELQLVCIPVRPLDPEPLGLDVYKWLRPPEQPLSGLGADEREAAMVGLVKQIVKLFREGPSAGESRERGVACFFDWNGLDPYPPSTRLGDEASPLASHASSTPASGTSGTISSRRSASVARSSSPRIASRALPG